MAVRMQNSIVTTNVSVFPARVVFLERRFFLCTVSCTKQIVVLEMVSAARARQAERVVLAVHAVGGGDDHHRDEPQHAGPLGGVRADCLAAVVQSTPGRIQQQGDWGADAQLTGVQRSCDTLLSADVMSRNGAVLVDADVHADPLGGLLADRLDEVMRSAGGCSQQAGGMAPGVDVRADGAVLVSLDADQATFRKWADARARHHAWGSRARRGLACGTRRSLVAAQSLTLVCAREGCGALVHMHAATRQARERGRNVYAVGDGCASAVCSANFRPGQALDGQRTMAARMHAGGRHLAEWPALVDARAVWIMPRAHSRAVALSVLSGDAPPLITTAALAPPLDTTATLAPPLDAAPSSVGRSALRLGGGGSVQGDDDADSLGRKGGALDELCRAGMEEACTQQIDFGPEPTDPRLVPIVGGVLDEGGAVDLPDTIGGMLTVGRAATSQLQLTDEAFAHEPRVHRAHATVSLTDAGAYELVLIGQGMATFVNDVALYHIPAPWQRYTQPPVLLADGDVIRFGGQPNAGYVKFVFVVVAPDATQPDRAASPLVGAPAHKPKPKPAPMLPPPPRPVTAAPPARPAAATPGATPVPAAAAGVAVPTVAIARLASAQHGDIPFDATPRAKTTIADGVAFVVTTRAGGYDLHVQRAAVEYSRGAAGSWVSLGVGGQRALRDGDRVSIEGRDYVCRGIPPERASGAAAPQSTTVPRTQTATPPPAEGAAQPHGAEAAALELASLAERSAQVRAQLLSGKQGQERREAERTIAVAHDALVGAALGAAGGTTAEHAARAAAVKLKKVADDFDKKRRRESNAAASASSKAERRERHRTPEPVPRAPGGPKGGTKRDRRAFENRTVARKKRRVAHEVRRVEIESGGGDGYGGFDGGSGKGASRTGGAKGGGGKGKGASRIGGAKGGGGKGKGGGKGSGKGGGFEGRSGHRGRGGGGGPGVFGMRGY